MLTFNQNDRMSQKGKSVYESVTRLRQAVPQPHFIPTNRIERKNRQSNQSPVGKITKPYSLTRLPHIKTTIIGGEIPVHRVVRHPVRRMSAMSGAMSKHPEQRVHKQTTKQHISSNKQKRGSGRRTLHPPKSKYLESKGLKIFSQSIQTLCTDRLSLEQALGNKRRVNAKTSTTTAQNLAAQVCMARRRKYEPLISKIVDPGHNATFRQACEARIVHRKVARGSEEEEKGGRGPFALQWERDPDAEKVPRISYKMKMHSREFEKERSEINDLDKWEREKNSQTEESGEILRVAFNCLRRRKYRITFRKWKEVLLQIVEDEESAATIAAEEEENRLQKQRQKQRELNPGKTIMRNVMKQLKKSRITLGQLFNFMDKNRNNLVSKREFREGFKFANVHLSDVEVDILFGLVDHDEGGDIALLELRKLIVKM